MKAFLNEYMFSNRKLELQSAEEIRGAFEPAIGLAHAALGKEAFKPRKVLNAAVFDAVMVGIAHRLRAGAAPSPNELLARYNEVLADEGFAEASQSSTADPRNVSYRLGLAKKAFGATP